MRRSIDDENGGVSPYVGTRVTRRQRDRLKVTAKLLNRTPADLMREAIDRHLTELEGAAAPPG